METGPLRSRWKREQGMSRQPRGAKLRAVMDKGENENILWAARRLVRHCYGLIKESCDPWKSRITGRLREYFPISRRVERRVGKELSRTNHHSPPPAESRAKRRRLFSTAALRNTMPRGESHPSSYITLHHRQDYLTNRKSSGRN